MRATREFLRRESTCDLRAFAFFFLLIRGGKDCLAKSDFV